MFSGKQHYCNIEHLSLSLSQQSELIKTKWDCLNYGGEWQNNDAINFDNTFHSMLLIFVLQSGNRMEDLYLAMIDS